MNPISPEHQQSLVARLTDACGGAYAPATRRKYFISGPQWAAAYEGHALFHAPTRRPISFEEVIREFGAMGIAHWTTHDTDVIPADALGKDGQHEIVARIKKACGVRIEPRFGVSRDSPICRVAGVQHGGYRA
jgi:xylose isomerase